MYENDFNLGIKEMAKTDRPRERLMKYGAESLSNSELLAILISSGTRKESALNLAYRLLSAEKGDLSAFSGYRPQEYEKVKGIGEATACKISAAVEFGRRVFSSPREKMRLETPETLAGYLSDMKNMHMEVLRVAMFDTKMNLIKTKDVSMGGIAGAVSTAREIFADAIRTGAYGVVLIHNHPSGDPTPSHDDISITERMVEAGKLIGIQVMDHIVIGDGAYCSFREKGLLK